MSKEFVWAERVSSQKGDYIHFHVLHPWKHIGTLWWKDTKMYVGYLNKERVVALIRGKFMVLRKGYKEIGKLEKQGETQAYVGMLELKKCVQRRLV